MIPDTFALVVGNAVLVIGALWAVLSLIVFFVTRALGHVRVLKLLAQAVYRPSPTQDTTGGAQTPTPKPQTPTNQYPDVMT